MTTTTIGIRTNNRMVTRNIGLVPNLVQYKGVREIPCDNIAIGIRNKDTNVRYVKRATIPVDFDMELEMEVSKATSKVFKIFNDTIKEFEGKSTKIAVILPVILTKVSRICEASNGVEQMRQGFMTLIQTATAITEPILWFYALTACILMATGKKGVGWDKLKQVGYSYILITMLPTLFEFCRWISAILMTCIKMG